jgi:hypothetical protein
LSRRTCEPSGAGIELFGLPNIFSDTPEQLWDGLRDGAVAILGQVSPAKHDFRF